MTTHPLHLPLVDSAPPAPPRYPLLKVVRTGDPFASYGPRPVPPPRWRVLARSAAASLLESLIITALTGIGASVGGAVGLFLVIHVLPSLVVVR